MNFKVNFYFSTRFKKFRSNTLFSGQRDFSVLSCTPPIQGRKDLPRRGIGRVESQKALLTKSGKFPPERKVLFFPRKQPHPGGVCSIFTPSNGAGQPGASVRGREIFIRGFLGGQLRFRARSIAWAGRQFLHRSRFSEAIPASGASIIWSRCRLRPT